MEKTLTVVKSENFKALPKETQTMIKSLSKELKVTELNEFNPLIESMATIEGFKAIIYTPDSNESIQQYKDAKAFVGHFNAATKKAKKDLKAPYWNTGKKIDAFEKVFLARAKSVFEELNETFKPYLDEKATLAQEKVDKKNKASIDKIKELTEETTEQSIALQRSNLFNKYTASNQAIIDAIFEKVESYSAMALEQEKVALSNKTFVMPQEDINILLADQVENLNASFKSIVNTCISMITGKLNELSLAEEVKKKPVAEEIPMMVAPSMQVAQSFSESITEILQKAIADVELLPTASEKEVKAKTSVIGGLGGYNIKILNYLDED